MQYIDSAMVGSLGGTLRRRSVWYHELHGCWAALHTAVSAGFPCKVALIQHRRGTRAEREAWCVTACARRLCVRDFCARWGFPSTVCCRRGSAAGYHCDASKYFMVYALMIPVLADQLAELVVLAMQGDSDAGIFKPPPMCFSMCSIPFSFRIGRDGCGHRHGECVLVKRRWRGAPAVVTRICGSAAKTKARLLTEIFKKSFERSVCRSACREIAMLQRAGRRDHDHCAAR